MSASVFEGMSAKRMLLLPLCVLCLTLGAAAGGGSDADVLLSVLTKLMSTQPLSGDALSCSTTQGGRDPALTMTLSQSTLDSINDFLAHSLGKPIKLFGLTIPQLDPLDVKHFAVNADDPTFGQVDIRVNNVSITGLSTIKLRSVKLNILEPPLNFQIRLTVKKLKLISDDYYLNLTVADTISLFGYGAMWFEAFRMKLYADLDLNGFSLSSIHINTLNLSINTFQSFFGNLLGGGETGSLVNEVLDSAIPRLAQAFADIVKNMVNGGGLTGTTTVSPKAVA